MSEKIYYHFVQRATILLLLFLQTAIKYYTVTLGGGNLKIILHCDGGMRQTICNVWHYAFCH